MLEVIYIYLTIFTLYFITLAFVSLKTVRKVRDKYTPRDANLCVVVYASGHTETLENLLKLLKEQNYPKQNYTIYVILDKCENVSEVTLQSDLNVNVVNIDNLEPIGKSQAYSIIAEKLHDVSGLDAYIFLDASNYVDSEFLSNVNYYLTHYDVINPVVNYLPQNSDLRFWEKVKLAYARYYYRFVLSTRTRLGLTNILNSDSFIIKKDVLNQMAEFDFRDLISEVNYSYKLSLNGIKVVYIDDLKIYTSIEDFSYRIPSLSQRLSILWNNITKPQSFVSREFLLSLAYPNWLVCILGYSCLLSHTRFFPFMASYSTILITALLLLLAYTISLLNAKLNPKEYLYLFLYPLLSVARMSYNFPPVRAVRGLINNTTRKHVIEKMVVQAFVTDGNNNFPCKLELISDDGLAKVTFINTKGKKYTTKNNHLRMIDAMRELTTKLADYGLTLKTCQCCKYYQPIVDGSTNMVKGCCNCQFPGRTPGDMIPTLIWNTCPSFEQQNVVNLF